jgi:putative membrane protein
MKTFQATAVALAMAFTFGAAIAQSSQSAQPSGTGGAGTSATGGRSAPQAQPGSGTRNAETNKDDKIAKEDRQFIVKAAGSGMFEVQAAQLATTRANSSDVKSFAGMLVDHHTKSNDELTKLANAKGVELPAAPPRALRRQVESMGKKSGEEFDRDFVRNVGVKAHQNDIKDFEKASKDVKDPELKAFVQKTLPVLKEHLAAAQKLPAAGGKGGGANDPSKMGASGHSGGGQHGGAAAGSGTGSGNTPSGASTQTGGGNGANKTGS